MSARIHAFRRGCTVISAALFPCAALHAQEAGPEPDTIEQTIPVAEETPDANQPAATPHQSVIVLEDIVVTAQKREEDVRKVPIAVSTFSGDDLKEAGVASFNDLARLIPNVSFNTDYNSLYMRGVGTAELNTLSEQAVSYVIDGVYVPRLDYLKPGFMDVERIEVLKGPQGTLFGRNATAGVMNIKYGEPTVDWESYAELTYGSSDARKIEAVVSGPITDDLTFRVAGNQAKADGYTRNLADGGRLGDKDVKQARLKVRYDVTPSTDVTLGASYFDYFIGVWGGSEAFEYPAELRGAINVLDPTFETKLDRRGSANLQNNSNGEGWIVPLTINVNQWDHTFTSITAYSKLDDYQGGDIDGSAADLGQLDVFTRSKSISQELRVVSPRGDLEYVAGVFLFKYESYTDLDIKLLLNPGVNTLSGAELVAPFVPLLGPIATPVTSVIFPGGAGDNLNGVATVDIKALGVFGQFNWHLTDSLALLFGGRYSLDDRKGYALETSDGPLPIWQVLTLGGFEAERGAREENFSPKVSVTWDVLESATIYGTYAKGFRAGSYNIAALRGVQDFEFGAERSATYEAGVKTKLFGGLARFNFGGFSTIYRDYQLATFNGFSYSIANAEKVRSRGFESDLTAMVLPGLILTAAGGYNDGQFLTYTNGGCPTVAPSEPGGLPPQGVAALPPRKVCDLSGHPLHRAPKWTGSLGLNYTFPIESWSAAVFAGASASYKGFEYMDADLDPVDGQDGYWLYNALVGARDIDDRWSLVIHGENLADKLVKLSSGDIPIQPGAHLALTNAPRVFSATLRIRF